MRGNPFRGQNLHLVAHCVWSEKWLKVWIRINSSAVANGLIGWQLQRNRTGKMVTRKAVKEPRDGPPWRAYIPASSGTCFALSRSYFTAHHGACACVYLVVLCSSHLYREGSPGWPCSLGWACSWPLHTPDLQLPSSFCMSTHWPQLACALGCRFLLHVHNWTLTPLVHPTPSLGPPVLYRIVSRTVNALRFYSAHELKCRTLEMLAEDMRFVGQRLLMAKLVARVSCSCWFPVAPILSLCPSTMMQMSLDEGVHMPWVVLQSATLSLGTCGFHREWWWDFSLSLFLGICHCKNNWKKWPG